MKHDRVESIVETRENAGYQHFLLFQQCLEMSSPSELLTHYQTTNSRLFQTERISRRQFQI